MGIVVAITLIAVGTILLILQCWFRLSLEYLFTKWQPGYGDLETAQDFHQMPTDFFEAGIILIAIGTVWLLVRLVF